VTLARFRLLVTAAVVCLFAIVVTGATVRLTSSGLGCEHWPGCEAGHPLPEQGYHSYIEFGNRVVSGLTLLFTVGVAAMAFFVETTRRQRQLSVAIAVLTFLQAPLGAITVYFHLNPWLVMTHFLVSIAALAVGVVLVLGLWPERTRPVEVAQHLSVTGFLVAATALAVIVTGTFATASGPHPGDSRHIHRLGKLTTAVPVHAAVTALFIALVAAALMALIPLRREHRRAFHTTLRLVAVLAAQAILGLVQYHEHLPWGLVLLHVGLATALWTGSVALAATLWRAPAPTNAA
jgi:cytochrome c oxidase assembly protein subunit 15